MNKTTLLLGLGGVCLASLVAENGCSVAPVNVGAQAIDDSGEPATPFIIQFNNSQLKDRSAFIDALKNNKVVFRHNMIIRDSTGCDSTSLPNVGLNNPNAFNPCTNMGQQVTQRVGFKNKDNLRTALLYLKNR